MKEENDATGDGLLPAQLTKEAAEELYDRAMKMMRTVVNYKDMQIDTHHRHGLLGEP